MYVMCVSTSKAHADALNIYHYVELMAVYTVRKTDQQPHVHVQCMCTYSSLINP